MSNQRFGSVWIRFLVVSFLISAVFLLILLVTPADEQAPQKQLDSVGSENNESPQGSGSRPAPVTTAPYADEAKEDSAPKPAVPHTSVLISKKDEATARIYGAWHDSSGAPAAGRRIRLHHEGFQGPQMMMVATDAAGYYEAWVPAGDWRVVFDHDTYVLALHSQEEVRRDHREPLGGGARVVVTVEGLDVQPWNALVTLSTSEPDGNSKQVFQGRTDQGGRVVFEGVRASTCSLVGQLYRISGGRPIRAIANVEVPTSGEVAVSLLQPKNRLLVTLADVASGEPIVGADVEFRTDGVSGVAAAGATDTSGVCTLLGANSGAGTFLVRHPEFAPLRVRHAFPTEVGRLQLKLSRGAKVPVKATGEGGCPMAIILRARTRNEEPPRVWQWPLNESGEGVLDRLPEEDVVLEFLAAGCEPLLVRSADLLALRLYVAEFKPLPRQAR